MKKIVLTALSLMALSLPAFALSPEAINQLNVLAKGTPSHLRGIANDVYQAGVKADPDVADAIAESLLRHYPNNDPQYLDALAWSAKALGNVGSDRYRDTLNEVLKNSKDKRLNRHVENARKGLIQSDSPQYQKGSFDLDGKLQEAAKAFLELHKDNKLINVKHDMTMEEVYALIGKPAAETDHITGKQYIPFNFKGADLKRTYALYEGAGQVIFSKPNQYTRTWRVIDVLFDTTEDGKP